MLPKASKPPNIEIFKELVTKANSEISPQEKIAIERYAWNASVSLFYVVDWLAKGDKTKKTGLQKELINNCPKFQILRDVCDVHKHFSLGNKERQVPEAGQVTPSLAKFGESSFDEATFDTWHILIKAGGREYNLADVLDNCISVLKPYVNS